VTAITLNGRVSRSVPRSATRGMNTLRVSRDPLRVYLFLLTVMTVSRIHQEFPWIARFRPALVLTALVAAYAFLNRRSLNSGSLLGTWPARLIAVLFVFAGVGAPFGISIGASARFILEVYSKTIVFAFLLIAAIRHSRDLYTFVWAYVASCGVLVWMALFVFGLHQYSGYERLAELQSYDANDIGCVLLVGLCLTMLTLQSARGWGKVLSAVVLLGIGATIARSGSRGSLVGLLVVGAMLLILSRGVSVPRRVGLVALLSFGLSVASPPGYWRQMSTLLNPKEDYNWTSKDGRKQLIERGIGYMLEYPIFGLGINNFEKAECFISEKAENHERGTGIRCTPPHNSTVQAGAELGIPGLAMWLALLFGGIFGMLRLRSRKPRTWLRGTAEERFLYLAPLYFSVGMMGFAVTSFFLSFAWLDIVYVLAALMSGLYVAVRHRRAEIASVMASSAAPTAQLSPAAVATPRFSTR